LNLDAGKNAKTEHLEAKISIIEEQLAENNEATAKKLKQMSDQVIFNNLCV